MPQDENSNNQQGGQANGGPASGQVSKSRPPEGTFSRSLPITDQATTPMPPTQPPASQETPSSDGNSAGDGGNESGGGEE